SVPAKTTHGAGWSEAEAERPFFPALANSPRNSPTHITTPTRARGNRTRPGRGAYSSSHAAPSRMVRATAVCRIRQESTADGLDWGTWPPGGRTGREAAPDYLGVERGGRGSILGRPPKRRSRMA